MTPPTLVAGVAFPSWHPHPDVWALLAVVEVAYLGAVGMERRRRGPGAGPPVTRSQMATFTAGVAVLLLASDWPVHDVAEGYLYSVHMVQHLLLTLVAAPLLLLGTPAWMARRLLGAPGRSRRLAAVRGVSRPVPGLIQFNLVLVLSHWPAVVDATVRHHPLHFVAHAVLAVSALLMWLPVVSPLPEVPRAKPPTQMLYLFLQTVVPTVPASFLTFGARPLYHVYETFPRLWGIPALTDQQVAGLIMKIGGGFYLWTVIAVIFFRWYDREERQPSPDDQPAPAPVAPASGDDVLLWEDVERELRQLGGGSAGRRG
jgi:putative membrane protein